MVLANPMLMASDLTTSEGPNSQYNVIASFGVSQSSLSGNSSWSTTSLIWSNLKQFALSGGYTKMVFEKGKLIEIHSYSMTVAYLDGNLMNLVGYTYIRPNPKYGTYGVNVGVVTLFLQDTKTIDETTKETKKFYNISNSTSVVIFWTRPFTVSNKITLSPQVFVMNSPLGYNTKTGITSVNRQFNYMVGTSFDYKITNRFGLGLNYKISGGTEKGTPYLHNFLVGSRMIL